MHALGPSSAVGNQAQGMENDCGQKPLSLGRDVIALMQG